MTLATIPAYLMIDRNWGPLLFLFLKNDKLNTFMTTRYFDLDNREVSIQAIKNRAKPWSESEKVMLYLAFHLFNESNKFNLSGLATLDQANLALALKAIKMRFGG